jgi:hypothetical protein
MRIELTLSETQLLENAEGLSPHQKCNETREAINIIHNT